MAPNFLDRIQHMNQIMELPCNEVPTHLGEKRVNEFYSILEEELRELDDVVLAETEIDRLVTMADFLGDMIVYCCSEARRWGIPILGVLRLIMDSQDSKLVNGKPVPGNLPGKFGKGPDYQPPEPAIRKFLELLIENSNTVNTDGINRESQQVSVANAEDDGVVYDEPRFSKEDFERKLCPHCANPISDEVVKKLVFGKLQWFNCPQCRDNMQSELVRISGEYRIQLVDSGMSI